MLRVLRSVRPAGLLLALALAVGMVGTVQVQQAAAEPDCELEEYGDGEMEWVCRGDDEGEEGSSGGGGGNNKPMCDLSVIDGIGHPNATRYCDGPGIACWSNIPSEAYPDPDSWPEDPPSPGAVYVYKSCYGPDGESLAEHSDRYGWYIPQERSVPDLAWEAYGQLATPPFRLAFNPAEQAIIFIDTWWWAAGPDAGDVRSNSVGGVVAIAEPDRLEVDPGDGSGTIVCDWVTSKSDSCTHAYQRANADGYPARARLVYGVRYEDGGAAVDLPSLPDTLESGWEETTVPVHEVQAIVR
jgi:hypothetical protein